MVGTVGTRVAGTDVATALTTPEAPDLHALFAVMREHEVEACAMEVSSHALVLGRVDGVVFDVAVFLNLGRDHLDFHPDVEDYYRAKASLFTPERARRALVNIDDEAGRRLAAGDQLPVRTFSDPGGGADWRVTDVRLGPSARTSGSSDRHRGRGAAARCRATSTWPNTLAAVAACAEAGLLDVTAVAAAIARRRGSSWPVRAHRRGPGLHRVVDYAHKPDAVAAAIETLRPLTDGG